MVLRDTVVETKLVEQARLIAAPSTHHDSPPTASRRKSGITLRRQSQALFRQHRPQADSTEDDSTRCVSSQRTYARFIPSCCTGWRGLLSGSTTGSHHTGSELQRIVIGFDFGEHVFTNHGNKCQTSIVLHSA